MQQAEAAHSVEAPRWDMLEEAAQEFVGVKAHRSTRLILASAIAEGDAGFVDVDNGLVGEGRSVDVYAVCSMRGGF